MSKSITFY